MPLAPKPIRSNSFPTADGGHVTGAVAMAVDDDGNAFPIEADTPIGKVSLSQESIDALAAAIVTALRKDQSR